MRAQGGDADALEDLPVSEAVREVAAPRAGYVARMDARGVGRASVALGAERERKDDAIDPGAGVELLVGIGEPVAAGQPVARLYGERGLERAAGLVTAALEVADAPVAAPSHIVDRL